MNTHSHVLDPKLPQLAALQDPNAMSDALSAALGAPVTVGSVDIVRHKPERRAIARLTTDRGVFYAKTFASARGPKVAAVTRTICEANAFGPDVSLPTPVAWLEDLKTLVQERIPGEPIAPMLIAGDTVLIKKVAEALYRFHTSGIDLGREHVLARELSPLPGRVQEVAEACPDLASSAEACLDRAETSARQVTTWRLRPVHRDCYHDQMLVENGHVAIVDLDDAAMSEPAVDIANVFAHLLLLGMQCGRDVNALRPVGEAFVARYRELDLQLNPALLRYLTGTTLLRLAGIHVTRANGPAIASALLHQARSCLR